MSPPNNPNDLPFMPWCEGDFLLATSGWSALEANAYRVLLQKSWNRPLPASPKALAELCGMTPKDFAPIWRTRIREKFVKVNGGLSNARIQRDQEAIRKRHKIFSDAGRKGAEKRYGKGPQPIGALVTNITDRLKDPPK